MNLLTFSRNSKTRFFARSSYSLSIICCVVVTPIFPFRVRVLVNVPFDEIFPLSVIDVESVPLTVDVFEEFELLSLLKFSLSYGLTLFVVTPLFSVVEFVVVVVVFSFPEVVVFSLVVLSVSVEL